MADLALLKSLHKEFISALDKEDFILAEKTFSALNRKLVTIESFADLDQATLDWLVQFQQELEPLIFKLQQNSRQLVAKLKPFNENRAKSYTSSLKKKK